MIKLKINKKIIRVQEENYYLKKIDKNNKKFLIFIKINNKKKIINN